MESQLNVTSFNSFLIVKLLPLKQISLECPNEFLGRVNVQLAVGQDITTNVAQLNLIVQVLGRIMHINSTRNFIARSLREYNFSIKTKIKTINSDSGPVLPYQEFQSGILIFYWTIAMEVQNAAFKFESTVTPK